MNDKKRKIVKLLLDYNSLREEHIMAICECTKDNIIDLINENVIVKERNTGIIRAKTKQVNNRNVAAFDVVMEYLDRNPKIEKGKYPVNVTLKTKYVSYDIIAIKEDEINYLFENIDTISNADKIIIIIETKRYNKRLIKTERECLICTFPPLEIVDQINEK